MNDGTAWETARAWLWHQRRSAPPDDDIWDLGFYWFTEEKRIPNAVSQLKYRLSPMLIYGNQKESRLSQWNARDAFVLKWTALHAEDVYRFTQAANMEKEMVVELPPYIVCTMYCRV